MRYLSFVEILELHETAIAEYLGIQIVTSRKFLTI